MFQAGLKAVRSICVSHCDSRATGSDVAGGKGGEAGALRMSLTVRQMTVGASEEVRPAPVGDDSGHRGMSRGMPVGNIGHVRDL